MPLVLELPRPAFKGTPKNAPPGSNLEKPRKGPRPPLLVPPGCVDVARGRPVTASDDDPIIGSLDLITDGDKEAVEGSWVELGPGIQWAQVDLGAEFEIQAVVVWHFHAAKRFYHDVIVQVAQDEDFITGVETLFNNDHDNSAGLGVGEDLEYWESNEGKLIAGRGVRGHFVRCTSNGSFEDDMNHYTEIEVYAVPGGKGQ